MEKITIKSINKKLGFNYADYKVETSDFYDDSEKYNPLLILTIRELECLLAFNDKKRGRDYSKSGFTAEDLEP